MNFLLLRCEGKKGPKEGTGLFYSPSIIYPPLGLLYIAAALEKDGHKVKLLDYEAEDFSRNQLESSLKSSDAVGFIVYSNNYKRVSEISNAIKMIDDEIPIIVGGPHCIFFKDRSLLDIYNADVSVIGEGDKVIVDIARCLQGKKDISDVNGIYYRENNRLKQGKPIEIINDLDSLDFPARHLIEGYDYGTISKNITEFAFKRKFTTMITSRGCPFHCNFCARYGNIIENYYYRKRSAENIINEIIGMNEKYNSVLIVDDNFLADNKRAHNIFDKILENNIDLDICIMGSRADSADVDLYKKMNKANVKFISYGIESGNQDVLDFYNKKMTLQQIRDTIKIGRKAGITTVGSFILGAPIEKKEHLEKTIKFACSLPLDDASFDILHYMKGSKLWIEAFKDGKIKEDEYIVPADSARGLGNFTVQELKEYRRKAFQKFYYRPSYIFSQIFKAMLRKDFKIFKRGINFISYLRKDEII